MNEVKPEVQYSLKSNPILVICAVVVLFFGSQLISALVATPFLTYIKSTNLQLLLYITLNFLTTLLLLWVARKTFHFSWQKIGITKPNVKNVLWVIPAFILYFAISSIFTILATKFIPGFNVDQAQDVGFEGSRSLIELAAAFLSLVIITPIFEELIFRGLLFKGFRRRFSFWPSAIIACIIFATAHLQWNVAIDTFALSLLLCYLVEKSGSIFPSIALHALKNGLAFVLLFVIKA